MIRLQRIGKKNDPAFRVVVVPHTQGPKSGKHVEILGSYNPKLHTRTLKKDRILYWIGEGAQVSDTMHNMLVSEGIIEGKKINVLPRKSPIVKDQSEEAPKAEENSEVDTSEGVEEVTPSAQKESPTAQEADERNEKEKIDEKEAVKDSEPEIEKKDAQEDKEKTINDKEEVKTMEADSPTEEEKENKKE